MHSSSSCGGGCIQYDIEVSCPSCETVADIKLSKSCDNLGRLFYKCGDCGKFITNPTKVTMLDILADPSSLIQ